MMRLIHPLLTSGIVLLSATACNGNSPLGSPSSWNSKNTTTKIEVRTPQPSVFPLALSQNADSTTSTLSLSVQTGSEEDSRTFNAQYNENTATWIADVEIQQGSSAEFNLTWSERVRDQSLMLAQATKIVALPLDIRQIDLDISSDEYNLSFDADADGLSNLDETSKSTNPFDSSDPEVSSVKVEVNFKFDIPGDLADVENLSTILSTAFLNGKELKLSFNDKVGEHNEPVSDAEFDRVVKNFDALSQAIENKDVDALDRLATSSQQSDLFKRLIKNNYDRIEVSIDNIRLRNFDKAIMATLQIDSLIRANGDRGSLSEKYASRTITSRRVNGDWSKIQW